MRSDKYHLSHMKEYFRDVNIYTNYPRDHIIRMKIINLVGNEVEFES